MLGIKNFFPHPNELLIWTYPENLVKIGLMVEAVDEFCSRAREGRGPYSIDNLSPRFWLLACLGLGQCHATHYLRVTTIDELVSGCVLHLQIV